MANVVAFDSKNGEVTVTADGFDVTVKDDEGMLKVVKVTPPKPEISSDAMATVCRLANAELAKYRHKQIRLF